MTDAEKNKARLRGFGLHLIVYVVVCAAAVGINIVVMPEAAWFVLPMVGWGAFLALHVAYVMGLLDVFFRKP